MKTLCLRGLSALLMCAALALGASPVATAGDASRTFDLKDFHRIDISGVYDIRITVGPDFSVQMSGPEEELDRVEATVANGTLVLDQKNGVDFLPSRKGVSATVTLPRLTGLDVSGVVDAEVSGIETEDFEVQLSGVGEVELAGKCDALTVDLSGVGDLDAKDLRCKAVDVEVSGLGEASVYAAAAANARVSGMGEIGIYGRPPIVVKNGDLLSDIRVH